MHSRRKYGEVILSALVIPEIGKTGPVESNAGEQIWITFKNGQRSNKWSKFAEL